MDDPTPVGSNVSTRSESENCKKKKIYYGRSDGQNVIPKMGRPFVRLGVAAKDEIK